MGKLAALYPLRESANPPDRVSMDVQLFIRVLEWAREEAGADVPLHELAEVAARLTAERGALGMADYPELVPGEGEG